MGGASGRICLPMQKTKDMQVQSLGQEDPLEKSKATHSSILAMDRGDWQATVLKVAKNWTQPSMHV